jgi:hypothetical protein
MLPYCYQKMSLSTKEGVRFENAPDQETTGPDLLSSVQSQSVREESEAGEAPIKTD